MGADKRGNKWKGVLSRGNKWASKNSRLRRDVSRNSRGRGTPDLERGSMERGKEQQWSANLRQQMGMVVGEQRMEERVSKNLSMEAQIEGATDKTC
jgi:hypothetical protein